MSKLIDLVHGYDDNYNTVFTFTYKDVPMRMTLERDDFSDLDWFFIDSLVVLKFSEEIEPECLGDEEFLDYHGLDEEFVLKFDAGLIVRCELYERTYDNNRYCYVDVAKSAEAYRNDTGYSGDAIKVITDHLDEADGYLNDDWHFVVATTEVVLLDGSTCDDTCESCGGYQSSLFDKASKHYDECLILDLASEVYYNYTNPKRQLSLPLGEQQ
jgi:hypothetical protein